MNLRLDLSYDGYPFHGFARQPEVRTVQGDIELALSKLFATDVGIIVAGRTDAGVHALGQVVTVPDAPDDCDVASLRSKLNGMLGPEMSFRSVCEVAPDFHARFSARSRCYVYAIHDGEVPDPFFARTTWLHGGRLNVDLMNEAAGHLVGQHDFRSFGRVPTPEDSSVRTLYELRCTRDGDLIRIKARANAFIRNMVRSVVGTLVEVGKGKKRADEMPSILSALDRNRAGVVAPPEGLCLVSVEYDEGWSQPLEQDT